MENQNEVHIEEVTEFSQEALDAVKSLIAQLNENFQPLSDEDFKLLLSSQNTHLYFARSKENNAIIGMVTLVVYRIPYKMKGQIEDVVVDESARGKGVGKILMQYAINKAQELGVKSLNLTSNPKREAAAKLYESLGFEKRDTNVYRLSL